MSLRGVWVLRLDDEKKIPKVIFSRRWLTVERRAKHINMTSYYPIPADDELSTAIFLHCGHHTSEFKNTRDFCNLVQPFPIYELFEGQLWPIVSFQKNNLLYVSLPLIEDYKEANHYHLESPSITVALQLMDSIADIIGNDCHDLDECSTKFDEVYQFLCLNSPFGSPLEISTLSSSDIIQMSKMNKLIPTSKVKNAAWQYGTYKGVSKLGITISEEVRAVMYDKQNLSDVWDVNGTVQFKADLEGYPDILLTLSTPSPLDHVLTHPCVQTSDGDLTSSQGRSDNRNRKLRFSPPIGQTFTLATYQWSSLAFLPIRGYYQMKGDEVIKLLVQLKLHESIRNNFEYCEVHIPFFNRGQIEKVDSIVPVTASSSLALSQDRKIIIWTIGQKFPSKSLEVSLQASVHFYENLLHESTPEKDHFFVGVNAYIDLFFKIPEFSISGCDIDTKSITLFPSNKYKLSSNRELYSSQYRIWNSHGEVLCTWPQLKNIV